MELRVGEPGKLPRARFIYVLVYCVYLSLQGRCLDLQDEIYVSPAICFIILEIDKEQYQHPQRETQL